MLRQIALCNTKARQRVFVIPNKIIKKAPSAGLWEGQTDEGEMGISYNEIDIILSQFEKFNTVDKKQVEEDVRSILKIEDESKPVILDLESIRILNPGKFEIDIVSLMNRRPIVFKLQEGKYLIDIEGL